MTRHAIERWLIRGLVAASIVEAALGNMPMASYLLIMAGCIEIDELFGGGKPA